MHDGNVYRSADEGVTWELQTVNSKMPQIESTSDKIGGIFLGPEIQGVCILACTTIDIS